MQHIMTEWIIVELDKIGADRLYYPFIQAMRLQYRNLTALRYDILKHAEEEGRKIGLIILRIPVAHTE